MEATYRKLEDFGDFETWEKIYTDGQTAKIVSFQRYEKIFMGYIVLKVKISQIVNLSISS